MAKVDELSTFGAAAWACPISGICVSRAVREPECVGGEMAEYAA